MEWKWYAIIAIILLLCRKVLDFSVGLLCWGIRSLSKLLIFPQPRPDYDLSYLQGQILLVPKKGITSSSLITENPMNKYIPCRVFGPPKGSRRYLSEPQNGPDAKAGQVARKIAIYFHGNGEDIGQVHDVLEEVCKAWNVDTS